MLQSFAGTQEYMAPEIFLIAYQHKTGAHIDPDHDLDTMARLDDDAERALAREVFEREISNKFSKVLYIVNG
jgi:hypothetical protein